MPCGKSNDLPGSVLNGGPIDTLSVSSNRFPTAAAFMPLKKDFLSSFLIGAYLLPNFSERVLAELSAAAIN